MTERTASSSRLRGFGKTSDTVTSPPPFVPTLIYKPINEQLSQILPPDESNAVPDMVLILSASDIQCQTLVDRLREKITSKLIVLSSQAEMKAIFSALVARIQK